MMMTSSLAPKVASKRPAKVLRGWILATTAALLVMLLISPAATAQTCTPKANMALKVTGPLAPIPGVGGAAPELIKAIADCATTWQVTITTHAGFQDVALTPIDPKQIISKDFPGEFQMENVACKDVSLRATFPDVNITDVTKGTSVVDLLVYVKGASSYRGGFVEFNPAAWNMYAVRLRRNGKGQLELIDQAWCDVCGLLDHWGPSSALPLQLDAAVGGCLLGVQAAPPPVSCTAGTATLKLTNTLPTTCSTSKLAVRLNTLRSINIDKSCKINIPGTKLMNYQSTARQTAASLLKALVDLDLESSIPDSDRAKFVYSSDRKKGLLFVQTPWCKLTLKLSKAPLLDLVPSP